MFAFQAILNLVIGLPSDMFELTPQTLSFKVSEEAEGRMRPLSCGGNSFKRYLLEFLADHSP